MPSRPLTSTPALWRIPYGHFSEADKPHRALRKSILERDGHRCQDCGLVLPRHMEVRHLDDDHDNDAPANLVCVCPFCHLRDHLGPTGFADAAIIIAAPSLTQAQVNSLVLSLWYIRSRIVNDTDIRQTPDSSDQSPEAVSQRLLLNATALYNDLYIKGVRWTTASSTLLSQPDVLGGVLNELSTTAPDTYAARGEILAGLHVLPLEEAFATQCTEWFAYFDRTRPISSWPQGMDSMMKRLDTTPRELYDDISKAVLAATRPQPSPKPAEAPAPSAATAPSNTVGSRYGD